MTRTSITSAYNKPATDKELIDKAAAELVEELLECTARNIGTPWFVTISRKMQKLVKAVRKVK